MQKNQFSTDGFVVRRRGAGEPQRPRATLDQTKQAVPPQYLIDPTKQPKIAPKDVPALTRSSMAGGASALSGNASLTLPNPQQRVGIDLTLDDEMPTGKDKKSRNKRQRTRRPWTKKRIVKWAAIVLLILLVIFGGYFAYKILSTSGKIFKGNPISAIFNQGKPLKKDAMGQSNVLLFGTSEDDPGHDGAELTDSMMIASINQDRKDVFLVSIPRDLWVNYGRACPAGYQGKINALYSCVKAAGEEKAQEIMRAKVGEVFGLDIQYAAHVNYTALKQAVDAVGGITVTIDSEDPRGILDRNFDWDCPRGLYTCYNVKYPNGPANLNGKQALYLARARGANGDTYGLANANFDREKYQRKILIALKDKAVSAGTITNPVAVNNLLDALGDNIRTNFDAEEVKTLAKLGQDIKSENIRSLQLNDEEDPLVTTGSASGQSIVRPVKGLLNFSDIQAAVKTYATGDVAAIERATIDVLNASGAAGLAQTKANELKAKNLRVGIVGNAPQSLGKNAVQFYDLSSGENPGTLKKLEQIYGVKVSTGRPAGVSTNSDFVVIFGKQPEPAPANQ